MQGVGLRALGKSLSGDGVGVMRYALIIWWCASTATGFQCAREEVEVTACEQKVIRDAAREWRRDYGDRTVVQAWCWTGREA